ncbi:hypothetical protein E4U53_002250 [Claviceps sorghi]|nr:hypothetical protein E4U53_002250 [Claviceps sorghi]
MDALILMPQDNSRDKREPISQQPPDGFDPWTTESTTAPATSIGHKHRPQHRQTVRYGPALAKWVGTKFHTAIASARRTIPFLGVMTTYQDAESDSSTAGPGVFPHQRAKCHVRRRKIENKRVFGNPPVGQSKTGMTIGEGLTQYCSCRFGQGRFLVNGTYAPVSAVSQELMVAGRLVKGDYSCVDLSFGKAHGRAHSKYQVQRGSSQVQKACSSQFQDTSRLAFWTEHLA